MSRLIDADLLKTQLTIAAYGTGGNLNIDYINKSIGVMPTVSQWIPCSERLPKESGLYQVTDMQGNVVRYVFNVSKSSEEYWRRCVKAWMPLPEPYKE